MALAWRFSRRASPSAALALVDQDHSPESRRLALALEASRSTTVAARPGTLEDAWPLVRARRVYAVVHVPADWARRAQRGDPMPVVFYINEQYHAAASSLTNDVVGAIVSVAGERGRTALAALGGGFAGAERRAGAVRVELRTLYGPQLSFERALAGSFLPTMLHLFVLGGAAYAIGREFRDRTAGEWLAVAHGSIVAALIGKLLPLLVSFALLAAGVIAWLAGYRGWTANGSVVVWGFGLLSLIVACCAISALIIGLTGTLRVALALVAFANVTSVSFTGFTYPLFSMTTAAKVWSAMLPFHYFTKSSSSNGISARPSRCRRHRSPCCGASSLPYRWRSRFRHWRSVAVSRTAGASDERLACLSMDAAQLRSSTRAPWCRPSSG